MRQGDLRFIARALTEMNDKLGAAWKANQCLTCPIGELAALAAATLKLYHEQLGDQAASHWFATWRANR